MAIRAQFRGMPWPPLPNRDLKEAVVAAPSPLAGSPILAPSALVLLGVGLVIWSRTFTPGPLEAPPMPVVSPVVSAPVASPAVVPTPAGPRPTVKPSPGATIQPTDLVKASPAPGPYGYRIPETTKAEILSWNIARGKFDPFITALPPPPPPKVATAPPAPAPALPPPAPASPIVHKAGPPVGRKPPALTKPKKLAPGAPLAIAPEQLSLQGVITSDDEPMAILSVAGELQVYRVGDLIRLGTQRLWLQAVDTLRLTVMLKDGYGRKAELKVD